ncbi:MAG: sodium:solute symporter family protein [Candidatus Altiarchaeota archaeon]|nr:sodium:solute symporter family protein [Candidatus Altiarchaeota archaeon]
MDLTLLFAAYFVLLLLVGLFFRSVGSERSFILADTQLSFPLLVATVVSTFYGASALIGGVSIANQTGLGVLWFILPFYSGNIFLMWLLPRIKGDRFTLPDFLGGFYDNRVVVSSSLLLAVLCLVPESIIAGGRLLELTTSLSFNSSMLLFSVVVVFYTLLGGMRSVVVSDFLQLGFMLLSLLILLPYLLSAGPGSLPHEFLNPVSLMDPQEILVWCVLLFFLPITSSPIYQRIFASAPSVDLRKAILLSIVVWMLIDSVVVLSGLVSIQYGLDDPDQAIFAVGSNLLPPILQAVFYIGLLSAIMSTADSFLHAGASSLSHDLFRRFSDDDRFLVPFSRLMVFSLGFLSLLLALYLQRIIPALIFLSTVWTSGILVPILSALFSIRLSSSAAFSSILCGSLAAVFWHFLPLAAVDPLFIGLSCSLISASVVNKFT